jgi:diphthamide synthase (EF-2-diphthine--ammonia ligase)
MEYLIEKAKSMNACVFYSGGIDSLVLLHLLKEEKFPVITFAEDFTKEQMKKIEKVVLDYDLILYSYPPRNRYFLPNGSGFSLMDEYGFSGQIIPVVRDIEDSDEGCLAELSKRRFDNFSFGFNCVLTGTLKEDFHPVIGNPMDEIKEQGNITFINPLWNWSKREVEEKAAEWNLTAIADTGDLQICSKCLHGETFCPKENRVIPGIDWNPELNLQLFKEKFYEH